MLPGEGVDDRHQRVAALGQRAAAREREGGKGAESGGAAKEGRRKGGGVRRGSQGGKAERGRSQAGRGKGRPAQAHAVRGLRGGGRREAFALQPKGTLIGKGVRGI